MIHRACALLSIATLLTACGGGGGGGSANLIPPKTPSKAFGSSTFAFKIPGRATMTKVRRPYYTSQATAGVGIDWLSSTPTHPDYSAPLSATCPGTLPAGVSACSIDAQGNTDYTFLLQIPVGTYTFTVSTFDTDPVAGAFTGNMLAQGQVAAPITIVAGQANTIPALTFYGIPASVSFVPAESESHVTPLNNSGANGYGVIGNQPQTFYAQAVDADGFAIGSSDSGAPAITVAESASDTPQYFSIATTAQKYAFTLKAKAAPASATTSALINVTATATTVAGSPPATYQASVTPVQELWTTQAAGGSASSYGLAGYALFPNASIPYMPSSSPLDLAYDNPNLNLCGSGIQCQFEPATELPDGTFVAEGIQTGLLYHISPTPGNAAPLPTSALPYTAPMSIADVSSDALGRVYVSDNVAGEVDALASYSAAGAAAKVTGLTTPNGLAVAPAQANIPASLQGTLWVGTGGSPAISAYVNAGSTLTPITVSITDSQPPLNVTTLGFDANGYLWAYDGYVHVYAVTGSAGSGVTLTEQLATDVMLSNGEAGSSFGATGQGAMWMGSFGSFQWMTPLSLTGCPGVSCAVVEGNIVSVGAPVDASMVVP